MKTKLCVKCVREELATMRASMRELEERASYVEELLAELIEGRTDDSDPWAT